MNPQTALEALEGNGPLVVFLVSSGFIYRVILKTLASESGFEFAAALASPSTPWISKYRTLLGRCLDKVEGFLTPNRDLSNNSILSRFDSQSYEKFFLFSFLYPIIFTTYNYFKFSSGAYIGSIRFFPGTDLTFKRWYVGISLVAFVSLATLVSYDWRKHGVVPEKNSFLYVDLVLVFLTGMVIGYPYEQPYHLIQWIFGSVGIAAWGVGSIVYIGTDRCSPLLAIGAMMGVLFCFGTAAVGFWIPILFVHALHQWQKTSDRLHITMCTTPILITLFTLGMIYHYASREITPERVTIVVFGIALPLVNGVFDWLSVSVTRILLRLNLSAPPLGIICYTFLDIASAFVIIIVLMLCSAFLVQICNLASIYGNGACVLDLRDLAGQISNSPNNYKWLYLTFYSTFIPSLFHVCLMTIALSLMLVGFVLKKTRVTTVTVRSIYFLQVLIAGTYALSITFLIFVIVIIPFEVLVFVGTHQGVFQVAMTTILTVVASVTNVGC